MLGFGALRESEVLDFHQRDGVNMKKAWDRISDAHRRIMPWIPIKIVLRNFYHGLFKWCKHSLDIIAEEDLRKVEKPKPNKKDMLEIDDDWEPFVRISISNQDFLAFCDIGSMVSTMPKIVYDSLKLNMDNLPSYHEHANGDISEVKGNVKEVQVTLLNRAAMMD